jgi:microcystin-dependent protein
VADYKFFLVPFAEAGNVIPVPDGPQVDGSVSYTQGFTIFYEYDLLTNPNALPVPRPEFNDIMYSVTSTLQFLQVWGVPKFITSAMNGGAPYEYTKYAFALYDSGDGVERVFQSKQDVNTAEPKDGSKWRWVDSNSTGVVVDNAVFNTGVVTGDAVYYDAANSRYDVAVANGTTASNVVGVAEVSAVVGDTTYNRVHAMGVIPLFSGLTPGAPYYLSASSAGDITATKPTTGPVIKVGTAISATTLLSTGPQVQDDGYQIGDFIPYGGGDVRWDCMLADHSEISRTTYAALFAKIGTSFGAGNGTTTFNLPDCRRATLVGSGGTGTSVLGNTTGSAGGFETHTMTIDEMPAHDHPDSYARVKLFGVTLGSGSEDALEQGIMTDEYPLVIAEQGGGDAFNILQPSLVVTMMIKVK